MNWIAIVVLAVIIVSVAYGVGFFRRTVEIAETVIDEEDSSEEPKR